MTRTVFITAIYMINIFLLKISSVTLSDIIDYIEYFQNAYLHNLMYSITFGLLTHHLD